MKWKEGKLSDKRYKDGKRLNQALDEYLKAMGVDLKVKETQAIEHWGELMGDAVKARTEKIYIKDRVLYLSINSSVMRDELQQSKSSILKKFNESAGIDLIDNIFFR